jgi:hypothetical protein
MSTAFIILCVIAPVGAIDVFYYHLYRFRLFEREASVGEELTHLVRQACFVSIVAILAAGVPSAAADYALLALFAIDLLNSAVDVALEPRSRATLGGLPPGEYFLHFLGTFGSGAAAAAYLFERGGLALAPAPAWQSVPLIFSGVLLLAVEAGLFLRAWAKRNTLLPCCASSRPT